MDVRERHQPDPHRGPDPNRRSGHRLRAPAVQGALGGLGDPDRRQPVPGGHARWRTASQCRQELPQLGRGTGSRTASRAAVPDLPLPGPHRRRPVSAAQIGVQCGLRRSSRVSAPPPLRRCRSVVLNGRARSRPGPVHGAESAADVGQHDLYAAHATGGRLEGVRGRDLPGVPRGRSRDRAGTGRAESAGQASSWNQGAGRRRAGPGEPLHGDLRRWPRPSPPRASRRTRRRTAPRGPGRGRVPAASNASMTCSASAEVRASGFSQTTGRPAASAASAISAWLGVGGGDVDDVTAVQQLVDGVHDPATVPGDQLAGAGERGRPAPRHRGRARPAGARRDPARSDQTDPERSRPLRGLSLMG